MADKLMVPPPRTEKQYSTVLRWLERSDKREKDLERFALKVEIYKYIIAAILLLCVVVCMLWKGFSALPLPIPLPFWGLLRMIKRTARQSDDS